MVFWSNLFLVTEASTSCQLLPMSGIIASGVAQNSGCGSKGHAWSIHVNQGQQIEVKIYDFSLMYEEPIIPNAGIKYHIPYGTITEHGFPQEFHFNPDHNVSIYRSRTTQIYITINTPEAYFLLEYRGKWCHNIVYSSNLFSGFQLVWNKWRVHVVCP